MANPVLRTGILIGGRSRRMGRPKQLVRLEDGYLIDRIVAVLDLVGEPVLLGSGEIPPHMTGRDRIDDAADVAGPLAGVLGAVEQDPEASWLIAACDQPWITAAAIEWLLGKDAADAAAVMPRDGDRVQPFPGIYRSTFAEAARTQGGRLSIARVAISDLARHPHVATPDIPDALRRAWASVNTPRDLEDLITRV